MNGQDVGAGMRARVPWQNKRLPRLERHRPRRYDSLNPTGRYATHPYARITEQPLHTSRPPPSLLLRSEPRLGS